MAMIKIIFCLLFFIISVTVVMAQTGADISSLDLGTQPSGGFFQMIIMFAIIIGCLSLWIKAFTRAIKFSKHPTLSNLSVATLVLLFVMPPAGVIIGIFALKE
jgi:hypothetical protein